MDDISVVVEQMYINAEHVEQAEQNIRDYQTLENLKKAVAGLTICTIFMAISIYLLWNCEIYQHLLLNMCYLKIEMLIGIIIVGICLIIAVFILACVICTR